jgi:pimeloyl-[acyl-carrier protein] methyl ester esterase
VVENPERVISLINVTTSPRFIEDDAWPGIKEQVFAKFHANLSQDLSATLRDFVRLQARIKLDKFQFGPLPAQESLDEGLEVLHTWDLRSVLNKIKIPTSFFFGRLDPIAPLSLMTAMQTQYPQFNYVLFNKAAHMPFISHSDDFIHALKEQIP